MKILILYYSKTGHTLEAAKAVAEGIRGAGSEADLVSVDDFGAAAIADYDGLILGSPCWAGSITCGGVASAVIRVLDLLPRDCLTGMRCGGISVHSQMGGKTTVRTLGRLMGQKRCEDYRAGPAGKAGVPFSLWKGPSIGARDEARFKDYGAEFVV